MRKILLICSKDNVAVALVPLSKGMKLSFERIGKIDRMIVKKRISRGHKIALVDIPVGATIIKYGEIIGYAKRKISKGEHVHVHNIVGRDEAKI